MNSEELNDPLCEPSEDEERRPCRPTTRSTAGWRRSGDDDVGDLAGDTDDAEELRRCTTW